MMKRFVYVLLAGLALAACSKGRIIPDGKLEDIYYDMFLADQWLRQNPGMSQKADTTFFYEPIFRKHGYTFKDYDRTVQKKLRDCEEYSKLLKRVGERLQAQADALNDLMDRREQARLESFKAPYYQQDFSYPMFSGDEFMNYYESLNNRQYGFTGKIRLFSR